MVLEVPDLSLLEGNVLDNYTVSVERIEFQPEADFNSALEIMTVSPWQALYATPFNVKAGETGTIRPDELYSVSGLSRDKPLYLAPHVNVLMKYSMSFYVKFVPNSGVAPLETTALSLAAVTDYIHANNYDGYVHQFDMDSDWLQPSSHAIAGVINCTMDAYVKFIPTADVTATTMIHASTGATYEFTRFPSTHVAASCIRGRAIFVTLPSDLLMKWSLIPVTVAPPTVSPPTPAPPDVSRVHMMRYVRATIETWRYVIHKVHSTQVGWVLGCWMSCLHCTAFNEYESVSCEDMSASYSCVVSSCTLAPESAPLWECGTTALFLFSMFFRLHPHTTRHSDKEPIFLTVPDLSLLEGNLLDNYAVSVDRVEFQPDGDFNSTMQIFQSISEYDALYAAPYNLKAGETGTIRPDELYSQTVLSRDKPLSLTSSTNVRVSYSMSLYVKFVPNSGVAPLETTALSQEAVSDYIHANNYDGYVHQFDMGPVWFHPDITHAVAGLINCTMDADFSFGTGSSFEDPTRVHDSAGTAYEMSGKSIPSTSARCIRGSVIFFTCSVYSECDLSWHPIPTDAPATPAPPTAAPTPAPPTGPPTPAPPTAPPTIAPTAVPTQVPEDGSRVHMMRSVQSSVYMYVIHMVHSKHRWAGCWGVG